MAQDDDRTLATLRIVAIAITASIVVIAGVSEVLVRSGALAGEAGGDAAMGGATLAGLKVVLLLIALGLLTLAQLMKRSVVAGKPPAVRALVKSLIRGMRSGSSGSGVFVMVIPVALSEPVAVLGLVLLVLSGGESRLEAWGFFALGFVSALAVQPDAEFGQKVLELDAEVMREADPGGSIFTP